MSQVEDTPARPIMELMALLERRWALRLLWELRDSRRLTSRQLRSQCEASPTMLQLRLTELRDAGLVELAPSGGYALTEIGLELIEAFLPLYAFADRWKLAQQTKQLG
ncbi:winged helix-turn-helix transcriptional regulator [Sphingomonas sp. UYP23]